MGVFSKNQGATNKPNRNTFDLSFQNNLTMKMGYLYPFMCKETIPGDTFDIDVAHGIRFMPLAFPIQTKVRTDVHFFYVRNRNLWKDFTNFITNTPYNSSFPTLSTSSLKKVARTGELGDYLGLPTNVLGIGKTNVSNVTDANHYYEPNMFGESGSHCFIKNEFPHNVDLVSSHDHAEQDEYGIHSNEHWNSFDLGKLGAYKIPAHTNFTICIKDFCSNNLLSSPLVYGVVIDHSTQATSKENICFVNDVIFNGDDMYISLYLTKQITQANDRYFLHLLYGSYTLDGQTNDYQWAEINFATDGCYAMGIDIVQNVPNGDYLDYNDSYPTPISALPFRAYESIYNSFYRDDRNNPYKVKGNVKYNEYIPTNLGGVDDSDYILRRRNWEQDFLTSALPTPQQGIAPLVGISSSGRATFVDGDTQYDVQLQTANDGDTITGATYNTNLPNSVSRALVDFVSSGISINDFRNVNSFQRWLETNIRKGLKYKDQIESHFGVTTSYELLDMPEFLGGYSSFVDIQQINQTSAATDDSPLGSYAGQASSVGSNKHKITKYCDEHGFIIGIISVVPIPAYSQLLPKHFTKLNTLDYFFPEFGHIGLQPIPYREVCPLQAATNNVPLTDTFGYQRAWYDYLASTDEVHGLFRTSLHDFVLSRLFQNIPSLNEEFLTIHPNQLNDIFTVNEVNGEPVDTMLGQIHCQVYAKRPIPRYGIPRIE